MFFYAGKAVPGVKIPRKKQEFENEELYQLFANENIEFAGHFFVGICVGIRPDRAAELVADSFERFNLLRFSVYNQIAQKLRGKAFVLRKDDCALHIMGVFPCGEEETFADKYLIPVIESVEVQMNIELSVGVGMLSIDAMQLKNAYKTAKFAFELYYFEEKLFIDVRDIHKEDTVSFEDYANSVETAFRALITHDPDYLAKINQIMDNIEAIHYGNRNAAQAIMIEEVKDYIREHYAEDLSIRELAEVACVSQNYFSALFKKETGQNYKAYLTSIRMEEAIKLLIQTDAKTYEIGEKAGYNNVRRFVDAFKQIYSMSPMEYRKTFREDKA